MQPEITTRIRRDTLMELLETEAPLEDQRITARMPVVTLSDLLSSKHEAAPAPDPDTFDPPTGLYVRAVGTNPALQRLEPALASALIDPSRLPTEPMAAAAPPFELAPLNEEEIASILAPLDEHVPAPSEFLAVPFPRMLVIAASCTLTVLVVLLLSLL